ncbi:MAG: uracil-DNA glycosylase [Thermodesulfovibrionales bacterium]
MKISDLTTLLHYYKSLGFSEIYVTPTFQPTLNDIKKTITDCQRCKLCSSRTNIVFGEGNEHSEIMFIGEGPGADEDKQGRPFVGKAGQLLTSLIQKLGLSREDVYIANIVKCRPPNNRDPEPDEISACYPYLKQQIAVIKPKVIMALGKVSTHTLLNIEEPLNKFSIMKARGNFSNYIDGLISIPVMPTYHPSYLLRNSEAKWDVWDDAQKMMRRLKDG